MPTQVTSPRVAERGTSWNSEQRANAALIIRVGKAMGMSTRDILIGLMTAMQESSLRNLRGGDRDSAGLFQQRPSVRYSNGRPYWGTYAQVTNAEYATRRFFTELKTVANRNGMSLTQAAQRVQRSAYPNAYAKHETAARKLLGEPVRTGSTAAAPPQSSPRSPRVAERGSGTTLATGMPTSPRIAERGGIGTSAWAQQREQALDPDTNRPRYGFGASALAPTPPSNPAEEWDPTDVPGLGPTSLDFPGVEPTSEAVPIDAFDARLLDQFFDSTGDGPGSPVGGGSEATSGIRGSIVAEAKKFLGVPYVWGGSTPRGFDCSGFVQYVFAKYGKNLPRVSFQQANAGRRIGLGALQPGDLVAWDNSPRNNGADHIAIYLGDGKIIEAPRPGLSVRIRDLRSNEGAWGVRIL